MISLTMTRKRQECCARFLKLMKSPARCWYPKMSGPVSVFHVTTVGPELLGEDQSLDGGGISN